MFPAADVRFPVGRRGHHLRNPGSLELPELPDDSYGFVEVNNRKPGLIKAMRSIRKRIDGFYELLIKLGEAGKIIGRALQVPKAVLKLQPKQTAALGNFNVMVMDAGDAVLLRCEGRDNIFPAWKALAKAARACSQPVAAFARCMLDPALPYGSGVFEFLSGNAPLFRSWEQWLSDNGYGRRELVTETGSRIEWSKPFPGKEEGGLSIWYDYRKRYPVIFEPRIPRFRLVLSKFEALDVRLKRLIIERTKKCDGCGYCIQTDRARRNLMTLQAEVEGVTHAICPFFPYLCFHGLDDGPVQAMEGLLAFSEWALTAQ